MYLPVLATRCRAELLSMNTGQVPPAQLRQGLTALCINKAPGRSTYRGTRAGLDPHRTIPVIVTCVRTNTGRPDESRGRYLYEIELSHTKCQPTAQPLVHSIFCYVPISSTQTEKYEYHCFYTIYLFSPFHIYTMHK